MRKGFSLVELSIVLVILGLLVGGILAGKSLIHAAELRSVSRDFQKYTTAVFSFRDRYFYLPGDIPNATQFWGSAGGTGLSSDTACSSVVSTGTATCDGDGDGWIGYSYYYESYRAWQHLANAGLIEGTYTGAQDTVTGFLPTYFTRGTNLPSSRVGNGAFTLGGSGAGWPGAVKFGVAGTTGNNFRGQHILLIQPLSAAGANAGTPQVRVFWGALSHEDAWNIDTKMDDGVANTGKVRADVIKAPGAAIAITNMTCQAYDLTNTTDTCVLGYIFGN